MKYDRERQIQINYCHLPNIAKEFDAILILYFEKFLQTRNKNKISKTYKLSTEISSMCHFNLDTL